MLISFGVCNTIGSPLVGLVTKYIGRPAVIFVAFLLNSLAIIGLRIWVPDSNEIYYFFVFPSIWGLADSIWQTQNGSKYFVRK